MGIKIGIIGCGAITRGFHIPCILQNPNYELVALVDPDIEVAKRLTKEFGISVPVSSEIRNLPPMDAVIVAAPPHLHAEICVELLNKGIHVLCEKPMANDLSECQAMMKAAQESKSVLLVGMQKHYCQNMALLKEILSDGMLGNIKEFKLISAIKSQWDTANLKRFDPDVSKGGILFEHGIHWIYRILYWFGYPVLKSYKDDRIDGVEVNAFIEADFKAYDQTIPGSMYFSWDHNLDNKIMIYGEKGEAEVSEYGDASVFVTREINGQKKIMEIRNHYDKEKEDLFALQLECFAECINSNAQDLDQTVLAMESLKFVEECYSNRLSVEQPWVYHGIEGTNVPSS